MTQTQLQSKEDWINSQILTRRDDTIYNGTRYASPQLVAYIMRRDMGLPKEFYRASFQGFETPTPAHQSLLQKIRSWADCIRDDGVGHGLFISGNTGIGKTHLAVCALKALLASRRILRYVDFRELMNDCRGGNWDDDPVEKYCEPFGLLIDDLGAIDGTTGQREKLAVILAKRINDQSPTIITTNHTFPIQTRKWIDARLESRMQYFYQIIQPEAGILPDWRQK